jgi:hypothetical protein
MAGAGLERESMAAAKMSVPKQGRLAGLATAASEQRRWPADVPAN